MSVPDVSGKAIANLEVESLRHVAPTFHVTRSTVRPRSSTRGRALPRTTEVWCRSRPSATTKTAPSCVRRKVLVPKNSYLEALSSRIGRLVRW